MNHEESIPSTVDRSGAGSPERFVERLNRQLRKIGIVVERTPAKTRPSGGPLCFRMSGVSYRDWLAQASIAYETLPYRLSMPTEPNYCHDCTPAFKEDMEALGACIFPNTRFEEVKELGESVVVGISRGPEVAPESYDVYAGILDRRTT